MTRTITNLQALKERINIVEIIGQYLDLKKSGHSFFALCPFHNEKTASFSISLEKQIYHCFGCNKSGDSINFIMEYLKLDFIEAVEHIAAMLQFSLEFSLSHECSKDNSYLKTCEAFLNHCLERKEYILEYMQQRGFSQETIETFKIGYAGENFEIDSSFSDKKIALELGILKDNGNKYISPFSKRLIIPVFSSTNTLVGFAGRILKEGNIQEAKYINSKESKIYKKSSILYGYNIAKKFILQHRECYIVEGYLDMISLYEAGIKHALALCGTALSKEQISLITKLDSTIILAYDNDSAGRQATQRAIRILIEMEVYDSYVAVFQSNYKDCNEMLLYDREKLLKATKIPIIEFYIRTFILSAFDSVHSLEKKDLILKELDSFLQSIKSEFLRIEYQKFSYRLFGKQINKYDKNRLEWKKELSNRKIIQYESGMGFLDDCLYNGIGKGFELGQLVLITGEPDSGKTSLIWQILENLSKHNITYLFSLEFSVYKSIIKREHTFKKLLQQGSLTHNELEAINNNMYILDDINNIKEIEAKITYLALNNVKFFAIDSQMCLDIDTLKGEEAESEKFKILHKLAKRYDILIFLITQTSKMDNNSPFGSKKGSYFSSLIIRVEHNKIKINNEEVIDKNSRSLVFVKNKQGYSNHKVVVDFDTQTQIFSGREGEVRNKGSHVINSINLDSIETNCINNAAIPPFIQY